MEISDERKAALIEEYRDINVDHDWWELAIEDFVERCEENGIDIPEKSVEFSGFWSQGDGAASDGHFADWSKALAFLSIDEPEEITRWRGMAGEPPRFSWTRSMRNCIRTHLDIWDLDHEVDEDDALAYHIACVVSSEVDLILQDFETTLSDAVKDLHHDLYKDLEQEYDYLTSDEAVWESIVCNEMHLDDDEESGQCDPVTPSEVRS